MGTTTKPLPLSAVRFAPKVDDHGRVPASRAAVVPATVVHEAGSRAGAVKSLTVDASYDDGRTWTKVAVKPDGDGWNVTVPQPADARFVSLRSKVVDTSGNTAEQEIVRAHGIAEPS